MRILLLTLLCAGAAWASEGAEAGSHGPPFDKIGLHAFNLLVLLAVLWYFLRGRLRDALKNRALGVKRAIDEANNLRKEARGRFDQLERQLEGFEAELAAMRRDAERVALAERETLLKRAEAEAALVSATAERTIRDETERARVAIRKEAAALALDLARQRLQAGITPDDDRRLAGEFLSTVRGEVADG